jgi:hypothetical protein
VAINKFELDGTVYGKGEEVEVDKNKFPTSSLIYLEPVIPPDEKPRTKKK